MQYTFEGFLKFFSKKNNRWYFQITVYRPTTKDENDNGRYGKVVETMFINEEFYGRLSVNSLGKTCELVYQYNGYRPELVDLKFSK